MSQVPRAPFIERAWWVGEVGSTATEKPCSSSSVLLVVFHGDVSGFFFGTQYQNDDDGHTRDESQTIDDIEGSGILRNGWNVRIPSPYTNMIDDHDICATTSFFTVFSSENRRVPQKQNQVLPFPDQFWGLGERFSPLKAWKILSGSKDGS